MVNAFSVSLPMSLIGKKTAVLSLGLSCQTVFQIHQHAQLLSDALGEDLERSRLPLDWTLLPAARATRWIELGKAFPSSPDELVPVPGAPGAFHWLETGVEFWHDFKTPDGFDLAGTFATTRDKYERHWDKLRNLGKLEKVFVIVANTQNNLPDIVRDPQDVQYRRPDIVRLKTAFETMISRSCRMLCVTYRSRRGPALLSMPGRDITVKWIPEDRSQWHGSRRFWETTLRNYFANA